MSSIREIIRSCYPTIDEMPFCAALRDGRFDRTEILRAETVELYRALNTRGLIQEMYKEKLLAALEKGTISDGDLSTMEEVIDDEGETEEHIDHLDMRYKLFVGTPVSRDSTLKFSERLESINNEWMSICRESKLFTLMALTAAIEDWYAPLSAFFEEEYRKRGFTEDELELFIAHQGADVEHSDAQFAILEKNARHYDVNELRASINRTFGTSKGYDAAKFELAMRDCPLTDLFE